MGLSRELERPRMQSKVGQEIPLKIQKTSLGSFTLEVIQPINQKQFTSSPPMALTRFLFLVCLASSISQVSQVFGQSYSISPSSGRLFNSPARVGRENSRQAAEYFNGGFWRLEDLQKQRQAYQNQGYQQQVPNLSSDLFACMDPSRELWQNFTRIYNRKPVDSSEELERMNLFANTLSRLIVFNRHIQNEVLNDTNYVLNPEVGNYHFVAPLGAQNAPLWFADLNDCELGLIKYVILELFHQLDNQRYATAYKLALSNLNHLSLFDSDTWEQLTSLILVRLFDRFSGDHSMNQLFRWPLYLRKLAGFAYNRQVAAGRNFEHRMHLIRFAYPAYYKDLKFNQWALNRTADNWQIKDQFDRFGNFLNRKYSGGRQEKNRRLFVFRHNWSLVRLLNEDTLSWRNISLEDDPKPEASLNNNEHPQDSLSGKLINLQQHERLDSLVGQTAQQTGSGRLKHTQFSDLTDLELIAFMNNDFSILGSDREANQSAQFIEENFPVRRLDDQFRNELALELELRRSLPGLTISSQSASLSSKQAEPSFGEEPDSEVVGATGSHHERHSFKLARQVVDELINDVGLPMGPTWVSSSEQELYTLFQKMGQLEPKIYHSTSGRGSNLNTLINLGDAELADEQRRRFDEFKTNLGRFRAWHIKAGWNDLSVEQNAHLFRLADLSWTEIKLVAFRLCCLTEENRISLASTNASLAYLNSLAPTLCAAFGEEDFNQTQQQQQQQQRQRRAQQNQLDLNEEDLLASQTELYYLYCVHFNKHHSSPEEFERRFRLFSQNIRQLRRMSCRRALTVFRALRQRQPEALSSIDSLDPRRLHTEDLNLDRFLYFAPVNLDAVDQQRRPAEQSSNWLANLFSSSSSNQAANRATFKPAGSRFGVSYRREPYYFAGLVSRPDQRPGSGELGIGTQSSYALKLVAEEQDNRLAGAKYRLNRADRVYHMVANRHDLCERAASGQRVDLQQQQQVQSRNKNQRQCLSSGPYGDKSATFWNYGQFERLVDPARLPSPDRCHLYWRGLDYWAADLIRQDELMPHLIRTATCNRPPLSLAGL